MSVYLGQLGRLVELKSPASQQVTIDDGYSFRSTLEGRVKAQARTLRRRTWALSVSEATTPLDQAAMLSFASGEWGNGPFVWVSADAPVTNMLPPSVASCDPAENFESNVFTAGPMLTPDGWAGRSYVSNGSAPIIFGRTRTPVIPGVAVTGSAYILGNGAYVRLNWYDANNIFIGFTPSTVLGTAGSVVRSHVTALPPTGATGCVVSVEKCLQATRPALTWTKSLFEWAAGEGCPKAVIHAMSKDVTLASRELSGGRYGAVSYTITEVG